MSGVRTQWHLAELSAEPDPFQSAMYSGVEIDLTAPEAELFDRLKTLVRREDRFARVGLTCDLKDSGQDCRTCVMSTLDADAPRSRLCRTGKDQLMLAERLEELARERHAADEELALRAAEWAEVGEIESELADLLTEVGL